MINEPVPPPLGTTREALPADNPLVETSIPVPFAVATEKETVADWVAEEAFQAPKVPLVVTDGVARLGTTKFTQPFASVDVLAWQVIPR